jgi:hypothetical protein
MAKSPVRPLPKPAHQHLVDKRLCRHRGKSLIKTNEQYTIDGIAFERLQFFAQPGQTWRHLVGPEYFERLRLKTDHRRRQFQRLALFCQLADNRLVTKMYTIEIANGGDAAMMVRPQIV